MTDCKKILLPVFMLIFSISVFSQIGTLSRVTLLSGMSYTGQIVVQNSETVMLQLADGTRYQFPVSEIASVKSLTETGKNGETAGEKPVQGNICGIFELSAGGAGASGKHENMMPAQIAMTFGTKQINGMPLFAGLGAGCLVVKNMENKEVMNFVPVFIRLKYNRINQPSTPYFLLDGGYSFAFAKTYSGGAYVKTSAGIQFNFSEKTAFYGGLFLGIQNFYGALVDMIDKQPYSYTGHSSIVNFGLNAGLQF